MTQMVRQPQTFRYGTDFAAWFKQFENFATAAKCDVKEQYILLLTYLDTKSFTLVQNLDVSATNQANLNLCYSQILNILTPDNDRIPARLSLKYRVQKATESISEYAFELEMLANKAFDSKNPNKQATMVDTFCTGVSDTNLSIKLLEHDFETLSEALVYAQKVKVAQDVRHSIRNIQLGQGPDPNIEVLAGNAVTKPAIPEFNQANNNSKLDVTQARPMSVAPPKKYDLNKQHEQLGYGQNQFSAPVYNHQFASQPRLGHFEAQFNQFQNPYMGYFNPRVQNPRFQ